MRIIQKLLTVAEKALNHVFALQSGTSLSTLLTPREHSLLLSHRRAGIITSRVRMVAGVFAILTPLWIIIDFLVFPWPLMAMLAAGRIITSIAFALLALLCKGSSNMRIAYRAMAIMFLIPTLFFLFSHPLLSHYEMTGAANAIAAGYAFLPFVLAAGLSVFPLTVIEGLVYASPVLLAEALAAIMQLDLLSWSSHLGAFWLLLLIVAVAILAGMSQLSFMEALVDQGAHDPLTGSFNRSSGINLLDVLFNLASRNQAPLCVAFADLDNFKHVNDVFGHQEGDIALEKFANAVKNDLRKSDLLLRWGGEEFLLVLPNTSCADAVEMVNRLRLQGFGLRPDGKPQTASFGIAESVSDSAATWGELVTLADQRMYRAKQAGKDTVVGCI